MKKKLSGININEFTFIRKSLYNTTHYYQPEKYARSARSLISHSFPCECIIESMSANIDICCEDT